MTKLESLAKDCIENHTHKLVDKPTKQDIYLREESIYISGYKECERRMKCCGNCKHEYAVDRCYDDECENLSHWELMEEPIYYFQKEENK